jgi:hypothetical protein
MRAVKEESPHVYLRRLRSWRLNGPPTFALT